MIRFGVTKRSRDQAPERGKLLNLPEGSGLKTGIAQELPFHRLQFTPTKETKINIITKLTFKEKQ